MRRNLRFIGLLILLAGFTVGASAQGVVESVADGAGTIDWSNQVIQAKGSAIPGGVGGRPGQIRAAEMDALRNILMTVKGARLSSETTVENFMLKNDVIRTSVEGMVRNFRRVGEPVYFSDGSIEVTIEMDMRGQGRLYDAVLPQRGQVPPPVPVSGTPSNSRVYSGLIVDARGLGLRPAIAPNIYSERGDEVYGSRYVDREWAIKQGMVSYAKDQNKARQDERVASNPLIIKAKKVRGANRTDVVISEQDALTLHQVSDNLKFLQECRVIFLVD